MLHGVVESVTLVEHIHSDLDLCKIEIDMDMLHIFYSYNELLQFIGKPVEYDVRPDIYKGAQIVIVANIVDAYKIQTLDRDEGMQLMPKDAELRPACNFSIDTLKSGSVDYGCIAFLSSYEMGASLKTKWIDCTMVDAKSKVFSLRIFTKNIEGDEDPEELIKAKVGHYIKFDIASTKFGYQTSEIELVNVPVLPPPEVDVAVKIIKEAIQDDAGLLDYVEKFSFIDELYKIVDYEKGYNLVRIASEILMAESLNYISNTYDVKTMIRAAVTSRGYLLTTKTHFSRPVLNVTKVLKTKLGNCRELLLILDPLNAEEKTPTARMYMQVAVMVDDIINERRGIAKSDDGSLSKLRESFGLLV